MNQSDLVRGTSTYKKNVEENRRKQNQAEYLLLRLVDESDTDDLSREEIQRGMKQLLDELEKDGGDSPIHYIKSHNPNGFYSKALAETINRCVGHQLLERTESGKLRLTEIGREYLSNSNELERYDVNAEFRDQVSRIIG